MRRMVAGLWSVLLIGVATQVGCGPENFSPPPNLVATPNTTTSASAKVVYLVLPEPAADDSALETWVLAGQAEAAAQRAIFRVVDPASGTPPGDQAAAIRKAIDAGASALVVVPHDPGAIAPVLSEAESRGVAVVTLGATAPADPPLPGTAVIPQPFSESAASLVKAVVEDAREKGDPSQLRAVILIAADSDRFSDERVATLAADAKKAGLAQLDRLTVEVKGEVDGRSECLKTLTKYLGEHPETAIVLAEGDEGLAAAHRFRSESEAKSPIVVAGYIGFVGQTNPSTLMGCSAFVEGKLDILARLAVQTALEKAGGAKVGPTVVMPTPLNRTLGGPVREESAPPDAGSPRDASPTVPPTQP